MDKDAKREKLAEIWADLQDEYPTLRNWIFKINGNKQRAGVCRYGERSVEVAGWTLNAPLDEVKDTLLHEAAHALCPERGHGRAWKRWARKVGANPSRCYDDDMKQYRPKPNYYLVCKACNTALMSRYRRSDVSRKYHPPCGEGAAGQLAFVDPDEFDGTLHDRITHQ